MRTKTPRIPTPFLHLVAAITAALALGAGAAQAAPITVNQSSFESPDAAGFPIRNVMGIYGPLTGWNPHPWAWSQYVVENVGLENGGLTLSGVTGTQFLMLDPATDGFDGSTWSMVSQNTGADFAAGTYSLTVDVGYAIGWMDQGKDSTFTMQLVAADGEGNWTAAGSETTISAATLAAHDGSLAPYTHTFDVIGNEAWIGQDVVIFMRAASPYGRGSEQANSYWQNVSLDNVRLDFVAIPEPSTLAMLLGGIGAVALLRRRRK